MNTEKKNKQNTALEILGPFLNWEFAFEFGRIRKDKETRQRGDDERQIIGLFEEAYTRAKAGASPEELSQLLTRIIYIGKRSGFFKDQSSGKTIKSRSG